MAAGLPAEAPPRVGLMLPTSGDPRTGQTEPGRLIEAARRAEAGGFDGVYCGDHLLHPNPILESVTSLAAVAATTTRLTLGPCVMLVALRDPLLLAKQLGTLAAFAPGRLRVGVGVGGEYPGEYRAAGVPLEERARRTDTTLAQLRELLSFGLTAEGVCLSPVEQVPFFAGGSSEAALARAATTDGWIGYLLSAQSFARRRARVLELADHPVSTGMLVACHVTSFSAEGEAAAAAAAGWSRVIGQPEPLPERFFAAGSPSRVAGYLHDYWQAGCDEFMIAVADQGPSLLDQVDRLVQDVLPLINAFS